MQNQRQAQLLEAVQELRLEAEKKIYNSLKAKGLVLTGALSDSVTTVARELENGLVYEIEIGFQGYGRLKDMRNLRPGFNIEAMLKFIDEVGLDKFKFIPGYYTDTRRRKPIDSARARIRLAWALAISQANKKSIKRKGKAWFNPIKGKLEFDFATLISERLAQQGQTLILSVLESKSQ
jgi:hypothetical protein